MSSPYWSPPEEEEGRVQEAKDTAGLIRDPQNIVFLITKSSNRNYVYYRYFETDSSCGITPQWAMVEQDFIRV